MIILEEPYVSPYLRETIIAAGLPVLRTPIAETQDFPPETVMLDDAAMVARMTENPDRKLYSTSEHAIQWITENLQETGLPETIALFKDKAAFRRLIRPLYPDFFFREIAADDLKHLDVSRIPKPFILKPSVGFFSAGVHMVASDAEWESVLINVQDEMDELSSLFPPQVCQAATWIIEEYVSGTEIAVDAFYTATGEPVVLDILSHLFASDADVDDKVYLTSKTIVREYLVPVTELLRIIQKETGIRNFPLHIELRVTDDGTIVPIELNPMRFAGWCTTDIAEYAHGINVYRAYFEEIVPDWDALSCADDGDTYALLIAKPPADIPPETICGFDYDGFFSSFSHPLEMRPIDFTQYPVFGFCYVRLAGGDLTEVERFMKDDLRTFIRLQ